MKKFLTACFLIAVSSSCNNPFKQTIKGNGNVTTTERNISSFNEIKCAGSYDVQLTQGNSSVVKIETDGNLQSYIISQVNGNELNIRTQNDVNIRPSGKIKLYITTPKLEEFKLEGSGDVSTTNRFSGGDHLDLSITGAGNIRFDVNTPTIHSEISGTGDIYLSGETKNSKIEIAGSGNYHAENLQSENAAVKIAGQGDALLFADSTLNVEIAGVGNVSYKGNASITQNIAGSGKIKKLE